MLFFLTKTGLRNRSFTVNYMGVNQTKMQISHDAREKKLRKYFQYFRRPRSDTFYRPYVILETHFIVNVDNKKNIDRIHVFFHNFLFYSVVGQTKSDVGKSVFLIAPKPPATSMRLLNPLAFKIEAAITDLYPPAQCI